MELLKKLDHATLIALLARFTKEYTSMLRYGGTPAKFETCKQATNHLLKEIRRREIQDMGNKRN